MRIVIDGIIFGLQKAGGISRLWADLLSHWDQSFALEHEVILLVPTNANIELKELSLKNIKIRKRKRFRWGKQNFLMDSLYLTFVAFKLQPSIWHQTYYVGFPLLFAGKKATTFHDMIPEKMQRAEAYDTKMKYRAIHASDKAIAISRNSERDLHAFWPEFKNKTVVIPNMCAQVVAASQTREKYFLHVGKRRDYKNFLPAIQTILQDSRFDNWKIKVIGGEELRQEEKNLGERVEFLGLLPFTEVENAYAKASLILFPSLYEGFGLPVLEAFAWGLPVLAMRSSSIPEVAGEDYPLADPKDLNSIGECIQKLLNEKEKWIAYGHERKKLFTVEKMMQNMAQFYANL